MSFLYPFILAGMGVVAVPIVLHMIRRHARHQRSFSSLMFLTPSTPRFHRRTKLEHLGLLILRCAIICLWVLALARPFWKEAADAHSASVTRRWVLLIDISASMRRDDLWAQAQQHVRTVLEDVKPEDRLCLMVFDRDVHPLMGFDQWQQLDVSRRKATVWEQMRSLSPTWHQTDLGGALIAAAEALEDDRMGPETSASGPRQIVCISDLQQGASLTAFQSYQWPMEVQLEFKTVVAERATNASMQWIADRANPQGGAVRVINSKEATTERFTLQWNRDPNHVREIAVPAGLRVVVSEPFLQQEAGTLQLHGDDHDFDNTLYVAPRQPQTTRVLFLGSDDGRDPHGLRFYLQQALSSGAGRLFQCVDQGIETADLIVVGESLDGATLTQVSQALQQGTPVWVVVTSTDMAYTLASLAQVRSPKVTEAEGDDYAMLERLKGDHPAMTPFVDPRFGDFTHVHIWHYRQCRLSDWPSAHVMAWLESDYPAWWSMSVGQGTLLVMAYGWQPKDSDLALSSKFVPLIYSWMDYVGLLQDPVDQVTVGDVIACDSSDQVTKPNGAVVASNEDVRTDMPGLYTLEGESGIRSVAVNLASAEGRTTPYDLDELEQAGLPVNSTPVSDNAATQTLRQPQTFAAMEGQQKLWRKFLLAALLLLWVEIWLSGFLVRKQGETA